MVFSFRKENYLCTVKKSSRCSEVGIVPGLGPGDRQFEPGHLDKKKSEMQIAFQTFLFLRIKLYDRIANEIQRIIC